MLVTFGSIIAGIPDPLNLARLARMMLLVVVTALALISMMFLLMVRVSDPLVPRAIFGVLNTVLFFPSGAVYPTQAFPALDESDHGGGPVHLRGAWIQGIGPEEHGIGRHHRGPGLSGHLHRHIDGGGDALVPAHPVGRRGRLDRGKKSLASRQGSVMTMAVHGTNSYI